MSPSTSQSPRLCLLIVSLSAVLFLQADAFVVLPSTGAQTAPLQWKSNFSAQQRFMSSIADDSYQPAERVRNIGDRLWQQLWGPRAVAENLTKTTSKEEKARVPPLKACTKARSLPNVFYATTPEECQSIAEDHLNKLTVLQFSSKTCQACRHAAPRFDRMATQAYANANDDLNFIFVEVSERNRDFVVQGLGIPALPYAGLFHPEFGMVETASVKNASLFCEFATKVESYRNNKCLVSYKEDKETGCIECYPALEKV